MPTPKKHESSAQRQRAYRLRLDAARLGALGAKGLPSSPSIPTMPSTRRWAAMRKQALALLEAVLSEMQTYQSDRSDEWTQSERGQAFQATVEGVEEAVGQVEEID